MATEIDIDQPVAVLLAKGAVAAAPLQEMARIAAQLKAACGLADVVYAFSEQGSPSLKETLRGLRDRGCGQVLILPMLVPMEPSFHAWITRSLQRWAIEEPGAWPSIRVGRGLSEALDLMPVLSPMLASAQGAAEVPQNPKAATDGSVVSDRKYRVLVCQGGACNEAGAAVVWGHLRNAQVARKLMEAGDGMRSAKTTCLGPCALAPLVQVYPDGVFYGGVDEAGMDRIIDEHLLAGRVVEDLVYHPGEGKQRLRAKDAAPAYAKAG